MDATKAEKKMKPKAISEATHAHTHMTREEIEPEQTHDSAQPVQSTPPLDMARLYKSLWGAQCIPFDARCSKTYRHQAYNDITARLASYCEIRVGAGMLYGPNGVGKSYLCGCLLGSLSDKRYKIIAITHSSLTGSDLLRTLCRHMGVAVRMRRSDNVDELHRAFGSLGTRWPVVLLEEAQNLSATALEEVRLLSCARPDTQSPFTLLLVGDNSLPATLTLGIHEPLLSRMGFMLNLPALTQPQSRLYMETRLQEAAIHHDPFDQNAQTLLIQSAAGIPRAINSLAQRAMEAAAMAQTQKVTLAHVQSALDQMPWLMTRR